MTAPEPFVMPEVDLRDFDYIPLYGDRLFNSDTWALCDADEKVAALRLWWRAWHEEPAGSLPNNDRLLAERAGYGVAVKAFLAVKENAMRGWILCSDGRLYHPVVASIAIEVWRTKKKKKAENAADRERKRLKRLDGHPAEIQPCPPDNPEIPPDIRAEIALKGKGSEEKAPQKPPNADLLEFEFGEFWKAYPKKDDRGHALKAYRTARKTVEAEVLVAGARRYAAERKGKDPQFTPLASTWLNGQRWADEGQQHHEAPAFGMPGFA